MTNDARQPRSPVVLAVLGLLIVLTVGVLTGLGIWQVRRLAWKRDLIARVDARVQAPPVAPPGPADWPHMNPAYDEYRHVTITGTFRNDAETLVQAVTALGAGSWVLTPLRTSDGATYLVNRGFVPPDRRAPASREAGQITGSTTVTGLLRLSEPGGGFLQSNDPAGNRWFSRDVRAIAAAHGLTRVAPFFIDQQASPVPGGFPVGGLTVIRFPNSHLVYALTWFSLAALLAGAAIHLAREEWRSRRGGVAPSTEPP